MLCVNASMDFDLCLLCYVGVDHTCLLCGSQQGHRLTPQDLWEVADLVSEDDEHSAYIVHMMTTS